MAYGKHETKQTAYKSKKLSGKAGTLLISLLLIFTVTVSGTVAFLVTQTNGLTNTFTPSQVSCEVTENFNGTTKSNVNVTNTSDIDAYIRVKLVSYRVNDAGQHIGGEATVPQFTPGEGWIERGGYYYYTKPVKPNETPDVPLIGATGITLNSYTDTDGGKQVIEVMAEAIQAEGVDTDGTKAVVKAWGVDPETLS